MIHDQLLKNLYITHRHHGLADVQRCLRRNPKYQTLALVRSSNNGALAFQTFLERLYIKPTCEGQVPTTSLPSLRHQMASIKGQGVSSNYNILHGPRSRSSSAGSSRGDNPSSPVHHDHDHHGKSLPLSDLHKEPASVARDLRQRSLKQELQDWWVWELAGALTSLVCLSGVVAILASLDGKPLSDWKFLIAPNAMIAIFTTLAKASLLTAIASCIGQLKWSYFQE